MEDKSWLSADGTYLLFNYVHLLKKHSELVVIGENSETWVWIWRWEVRNIFSATGRSLSFLNHCRQSFLIRKTYNKTSFWNLEACSKNVRKMRKARSTAFEIRYGFKYLSNLQWSSGAYQTTAYWRGIRVCLPWRVFYWRLEKAFPNFAKDQ